VFGGAGTFADWDAAQPIYNFSSTAAAAGAGVRQGAAPVPGGEGRRAPDTLVWTPQDAENFDRVYEDRGDAVLARYGITRTFTTVRRDPGNRLYLASNQVGTMAWEKPMGDPEYTREGPASPTSTRWRGGWSSWPTAPTRSWK
jgi:hypothetical protein